MTEIIGESDLVESSTPEPIPGPERWPTAEEFKRSFASGPTMREIQEQVRQRMQLPLSDVVINATRRLDC